MEYKFNQELQEQKWGARAPLCWTEGATQEQY